MWRAWVIPASGTARPKFRFPHKPTDPAKFYRPSRTPPGTSPSTSQLFAQSKVDHHKPAQWPSEPRRSELPASTVLGTVPRSVSPSRRWKLPSTPSTSALSAARPASSATPSASGTASPASALLPEVPTPLPRPLPLPCARPSEDCARLPRCKVVLTRTDGRNGLQLGRCYHGLACFSHQTFSGVREQKGLLFSRAYYEHRPMAKG